MLIKDFNLQKETVLEIGKFAILWNWFERNYCNNNCNPSKIKDIIKYVSVDPNTQAYFASILNKRRHWFGQLEIDYVRESLHPGNARVSNESDMDVMRQFLEQTGNELTYGCLLVLQRIRNNLMHGMKIPEELDGQIELFRAANAVLESIHEQY